MGEGKNGCGNEGLWDIMGSGLKECGILARGPKSVQETEGLCDN